MKYLFPAWVTRETERAQRYPLWANITRPILFAKGLPLSYNWPRKNAGGRRTGHRRPISQSVPEHTCTFEPRNRVRGAEGDRGQANRTLVGEQDHRSCQRHAIGCTGR